MPILRAAELGALGRLMEKENEQWVTAHCAVAGNKKVSLNSQKVLGHASSGHVELPYQM